MKSLSAKLVMKILQTNGFYISRIRGSHHIFVNAEGITVIVPVHAKAKEIPIGTFLSIVKQSKLDARKFKK